MKIDEAEEVNRFRFWSEGKLLIEYQRIPVARMMTYMASALLAGRRVFGRFGCDVIHSHFLLPTGLIGAAVAGGLGRPHVATVHGSDMRLASGKWFMRPLARWTLRRCAAVTATAQHQVEPLRMLGLDEARRVMMPMGIHEAFLEAAAMRQNVVAEKKIISTRTLREEIYNIPQLLRAMKIVAARDPEVTCTIAGDGPDRARFEALAREWGLERAVTFSGRTDPASLAKLLREHRLYVSTSRADGASVSLFEAMVSGLYPVVSDIAANREWIRDGENGRLFPLDDPDALARALLEGMAESPAIQRAVDANRLTAQTTFTWDGIAFRLEEIYRKAIGGR